MSHLIGGFRIGVVFFDDAVDPLEIGFGLSIFSFGLDSQRVLFLLKLHTILHLMGFFHPKARKFYQILLPSVFHVGTGLHNPTDNYQQGDQEGKL